MQDDTDEYRYRLDDSSSIELEDAAYDELYSSLQQPTGQRHALDMYKQMLEEDWLDQPLRELLEDRIHALSEG